MADPLLLGQWRISDEVVHLLLLFGLFVIPRALERFRLPSAITSLGLGAACGIGLGLFRDDSTIHLLSTLGIVSLFLFAGIDVEVGELRREARVLAQHLGVRLALLCSAALVAASVFRLEARAAALVSLALLTPSTGFILDTLQALDVSDREKFWIRSKAIATEILALAVLFFVLQSSSGPRLLFSTLAFLGMVFVLPVAFRVFAKFVAPHAPRSEFAFLIVVAIACAYLTKALGVYYLVGAFAVGMAAQRFRKRLPAMVSRELIHALELFASFFVPFYFFSAGLSLRREDLGIDALKLGLLLFVIVTPVRIAGVMAHRRLALGESASRGVRVAGSMLPTLVFTLVVAEILRERFDVAPALFGGLIVYAVANTLIPGVALRLPIQEIASPHAMPLSTLEQGGAGGRDPA